MTESIAPLTLDEESMRRLGYGVVDALVRHFATLKDRSIVAQVPLATLKAYFAQPFTEDGRDPMSVWEEVRTHVIPGVMRTGHPRFFGYIPTPSNFVSAMADALIAGLNVFAGVAQANEAASLIEVETVRWLAREVGLPDGAGGMVHAGGSLANLAGLAVAREVHLGGPDPRAVVYMGEETHSCIARALQVLGFTKARIRLIDSDPHFRIDAAKLAHAIAADKAAGLNPAIIAASAGTTNVGAIDPLDRLADLAGAHGLWLHVDGAYGGAAALTEEGKAKLAGIARADSLVIDGHKWLFQPIECSLLLVRQRDWLAAAFRRVPAYMQDSDSEDPDLPNYRDLGLQTSRALRAFKLWLSLKVFGLAAFRGAIAQGFELARFTAAEVARRPHWRLMAPADFGIAVFRYEKPGLNAAGNDALNQAITLALLKSGYALVSTTELLGRRVIRLAPIHPAATREDIIATLDRLEAFAAAHQG
ncbi:MAG: pyridoxal phosphate-dependent decarboxylase family protein [Pseudomonadota bacterium]